MFYKFFLQDHSGSITWNEFINYEAPSLLPFKNKLELANALKLKELIMIKRKFLSLDKNRIGIITKDDARSVYIEYVRKLRYQRIFLKEEKI